MRVVLAMPSVAVALLGGCCVQPVGGAVSLHLCLQVRVSSVCSWSPRTQPISCQQPGAGLLLLRPSVRVLVQPSPLWTTLRQ